MFSFLQTKPVGGPVVTTAVPDHMVATPLESVYGLLFGWLWLVGVAQAFTISTKPLGNWNLWRNFLLEEDGGRRLPGSLWHPTRIQEGYARRIGREEGMELNASTLRREMGLAITYCGIVFRLAIDHHWFLAWICLLNTYYKTLLCSISPLYRTVSTIGIV